MLRRHLVQAASLTAIALAIPMAHAADTFKIGLILPMTGQQASTGRQIEAAARLYMAQNGDTVAGKKIELIVKDDTALPDVTKRLAQELVVNDKVNVLAGFGVTPKPASTLTFSLTTSSCAMRLVTSGVAVSSLTISSIFLPATVSPFCAMYRRAAASIWRPVEACWPVIGRIRPILKVLPWASTGKAVAAMAASTVLRMKRRLFIFVSIKSGLEVDVSGHLRNERHVACAALSSQARYCARAESDWVLCHF